MTIPGGDRRISEPSTVCSEKCGIKGYDEVEMGEDEDHSLVDDMRVKLLIETCNLAIEGLCAF